MSSAGVAAVPVSASRIAWLDAARGIGIVLVVYGHVLRGLMGSGDLPVTGWAALHDRMLYAFHMPLFFLLAAIHFTPQLDRGATCFVSDRWWSVIYPYLLWTALHIVLSALLTGSVNDPRHWGDLATMLWIPQFHFWFLGALLVCQIVGASIRLSVWIVAAVAIAFTVLPVPWLGAHISNGLANFPYFGAGLLLAPFFLAGAVRPRLLLAAGLVAALIFAWLFINAFQPRIAHVATAFAGITMTLAAARLIGNRVRWLVALGQYSMIIFVLHTLFSSGLRIGLGRLGVTMPAVPLAALLTVAGLVLPVVAGIGLAKIGWSKWWGLGRSAPVPEMASPARSYANAI